MAKIGIDARLWGVKHTGIGRYVEELVKSLQQIDKENEYVLFCRNDDTRNIPEVKGWKKVIADINHYSLKEQFTLHKVYRSENLDLLHVPHFNVPILFFGKNIPKFIRQNFTTCVLYKGKERVNVIDRKDFNEDLISNYENSLKFLKA